MKTLYCLAFALISFSAFSKDFTCQCGSLVGCPERLTVEVKTNNKGELVGQISHFGVVSKTKLKQERINRAGDKFTGKGWVLTRTYNVNGGSSGSLDIFDEDLAEELIDAPTRQLRCFDK